MYKHDRKWVRDEVGEANVINTILLDKLNASTDELKKLNDCRAVGGTTESCTGISRYSYVEDVDDRIERFRKESIQEAGFK